MPEPTAAVPDPREDIDWSKHRGSCRVFYAERRCTCGADGVARPAEPPGELRDDEWWLRLFHVTSEAVDFVPYDAASEYPVPHVAAFRAAAAPLLAPLLDAQAALRRVEALADELDREGVVMLFHGPPNRNKFITARIRAAIAAPH